VNKREKKRLKLLYKLCKRLDRSSSADQYLGRLTCEQLEYVNHRFQVPCFVEACPGSGKTEVVGIKAAYEFAGWRERYSGFAILTFTRTAAAEIRERVIQYAGSEAAKHPHFIGTIDSWLHNYLLQPFAHAMVGYAGKHGDKSVRIVEHDSRAGFLKNYKVVHEDTAIQANWYYKNHNGEMVAFRGSIANFDRGCLNSTKDRFLKDGFATYQDAEYICYQVLRRHPSIARLLSQRFSYMIVDECQDLSDAQLCILYKLLKAGTVLQIVGDLNQSIFEFRNVNPAHVASFAQKQGFSRKTLTSNYRSNQSIVDLCSRLIESPRRIQGCGSMICDTPCILWQYTDETFESLPECFGNLITRVGLDKQKCCIVARGKTVLKQLHPQEERRADPAELFGTALSCWYLPDRSTTDIGVALHSVGKSLSLLAYSGRGHHQKQYCPDDVDPKVWRIFLADVLDDASGLHPFAQTLSWSQWTRKLRSYLESIWVLLPVEGKGWSEVARRVRAPKNRGRTSIAEEMQFVSHTSSLRITTIHDVKGETFEALLLVSSKDRRSQGGHFEHWLHPKPGKQEYRRFAYVACSRPQHLLVVATPPLNEKHLRELVELGLEPQDMVSELSSGATVASVGDSVVAHQEIHRRSSSGPLGEAW